MSDLILTCGESIGWERPGAISDRIVRSEGFFQPNQDYALLAEVRQLDTKLLEEL